MPSFTAFTSVCASPVNFSNTRNQIPSSKAKNNDFLPLAVPQTEDLFLDSVSSVRFLSFCTAAKTLKLGYCIHAGILKSGLDSNIFVANSLLGLYSKCGSLEDASKVFDFMPERTVVSWTSMMSGHCQNGNAKAAISIFQQMLLENVHPNEFTFAVLLQACGQICDLKLADMIHGNIIANGIITSQFLQNSLIDTYSKCGFSFAAEKLIEKSSCRDVVSWTSAISGCVLNGLIERAFMLFFCMLEDGVIPNRVTILSIIQACSLMNKRQIFRWIHGLVIKGEFWRETLVMNSLIEMYSTNGYFEEGMKIFQEFCFTGEGYYLKPETMASLLQGCGHLNCLRQGKEIHGYLIKHRFLPCMVIENSLMDMYAENKQNNSAYRLFKMMSKRDIISWNTMISCLVKNGCPCEALTLFSEVHGSRGGDLVVPDFVTILTSIQACSELASLHFGQVIHCNITKSGFGCDVFTGNSLITMYGKSGRLDFAKRVFEDMPTKDLGSWNSMIAAYGINGDGTSALLTLAEMKKWGVHQPNAITFVNILSACGHSGLVEEAFEIFNKMDEVYGVKPSIEHFACMVYLLGRLGRLDEAEAFIKKMPLRPSPDVWGALLGACGLYGNLEVAERAAKKLSILEPDSKVWRVTMSNVYAGVERWEDAVKMRMEMKGGKGLRKEAGWSSVEVRGESYKFIAGDTRHPESKRIYTLLKGIRDQIQTRVD